MKRSVWRLTLKKMNKYFVYISILLVLALSSCSKKTAVQKPIKLQSKSVKFLQSKIDGNTLRFKTLNARFTARTNFNNEKLSFKGILKMKKDSIIWISLTKLGGVEVVRLILTNDSIKFINKWDKEYFIGPIEKLDKIEGIDLGYAQIQDMLTGALINYNSQDKFSSNTDDVSYLLSSKNKSKIKKTSTFIEEDSLIVIPEVDKKLQKMLDKNANEDFVVKNYYLYPGNYFLARQTINLIDLQQAIDIVYDEYTIIDDHYPFALDHVIKIASNEKSGRIDLKYSSVQFNLKNSYPFKISSKYEPIKKRN